MYQPFKGVMPDGTEVLVQLDLQEIVYGKRQRTEDVVSSVAVAFRHDKWASWGPPVDCERAP